MKKPSSAGRKSQVESRSSPAAGRQTQDGKGTFKPLNRRTGEPATSAPDAVPFDLPVPENLLAKLRLASPSGDPAAAALSFLLDRFK